MCGIDSLAQRILQGVLQTAGGRQFEKPHGADATETLSQIPCDGGQGNRAALAGKSCAAAENVRDFAGILHTLYGFEIV
jgi:hypothetical protein